METIRKVNNYISSYWVFLILSAVLWVLLKIGKLPSFSSPDPKEIFSDFEIIFAFYNYSTFFILLGIILNIWFFIKKVENIREMYEKSTVFFTINISLWLIHIFIDPTGYNEWFFD